MSNFNQLKQNLQKWESRALKSHYLVAAVMVPLIFSNSFWTMVPLALVSVWLTICFWKHMSAKNKVDSFSCDD